LQQQFGWIRNNSIFVTKIKSIHIYLKSVDLNHRFHGYYPKFDTVNISKLALETLFVSKKCMSFSRQIDQKNYQKSQKKFQTKV